jgi:putative restriction endonuclease
MDNGSILTYIKALGRLNRASKNGIKAPHKPILFLSVIQSIAVGEIKENKIEITPQLVARFKDNWNWLVKEEVFKPNFALPFYHLSYEKFWHLQTYIGKEILLTSSLSIRSFSQLREAVAYAYLDQPLYDLLQQSESREIIFHFLLEYYFNTTGVIYKQPELFEIVTNQILHDSPGQYQHIIEAADEEDIFIRGGVFKKVVPQIYNYTCCISGMRIISGYDIQMVDACHIVPFSLSHNDTISNGISLSPNLHRAFDRGLVAVNNNYKVIVSESFSESTSESSIKTYQGKIIILPIETSYYPSLDNLEWHRSNVFKQ